MSDLIIKDGDLVLNSNNSDLGYYLTEENSILSNLKRRILTDLNQYKIDYYSNNLFMFKSLDDGYGSNIKTYIAAPNNILFTKAKKEMQSSLSKESRVNARLINVENINEYTPKFTIEYEYRNSTNTVVL